MFDYREQLLTVFNSCLLHLYLVCAESGRFVPQAKRNQILIKKLKPYAQDKQFRDIKSHVKQLLFLGRKGGDIESCILKMLATVSDAQNKLARLLALLDHIFDIVEKKSLSVSLHTSEQPQTEVTARNQLLVDRPLIETCFDNEGQQLIPMPIKFKFAEQQDLDALVSGFGPEYQVEATVSGNTAELLVVEVQRWKAESTTVAQK
jgi:hypothetical protein